MLIKHLDKTTPQVISKFKKAHCTAITECMDKISYVANNLLDLISYRVYRFVNGYKNPDLKP